MIFVCLGNKGEKYKHTRHNVGRMFGKFISQKLKVQSEKLKKAGRILELENGWQVVFLNCYMNNSGSCLKEVLKIRKPALTRGRLKIENLVVVHDDLDIPFGEFKVQKNRSSAGHKGVQSIINTFGTKDFKRIRIGIGRSKKIPEEKYVLMHFNEKEGEELERVFENILVELKGR